MTEYLIINKLGLEVHIVEGRREAVEQRDWFNLNLPEDGPYKIQRCS